MSTEINAGSMTFKDRTGRVWDVTLTMLSARRVTVSDFKELTDVPIDFLSPDAKMFSEIATKPALCIAIIWAIVKPQADEAGITEEQFLDALDGPAIYSGKEAFWDSALAFFPEQRTVLLHWRGMVKAAQEKLTDRMMKMMPEVTSHLDTFMETELNAAMTEFRGSMKRSPLPGSSDSSQVNSGP